MKAPIIGLSTFINHIKSPLVTMKSPSTRPFLTVKSPPISRRQHWPRLGRRLRRGPGGGAAGGRGGDLHRGQCHRQPGGPGGFPIRK